MAHIFYNCKRKVPRYSSYPDKRQIQMLSKRIKSKRKMSSFKGFWTWHVTKTFLEITFSEEKNMSRKSWQVTKSITLLKTHGTILICMCFWEHLISIYDPSSVRIEGCIHHSLMIYLSCGCPIVSRSTRNTRKEINV